VELFKMRKANGSFVGSSISNREGDMTPEVMTEAQTHRQSTRKPKLLRQLRGDWVELESADGEVYFANIKTKETSWDIPEEARMGEDKENAHAQKITPHGNSPSKSYSPKKPLSASKYNVGNSRAISEGKMLDQSVAAFNAITALSFAHSPESSQPPALTSHRAAERLKTAAAESVVMNQWNMNNTLACDTTMMGASFVGRESDAISDLAALADLSMMLQQSPRQSLVKQHTLDQRTKQQQEPDGEMCGVGIVLEQMEQGRGVTIEKVLDGGPAHQNATLCEGDEIISVQGMGVNGRSPSELKRDIIGPLGSTVTLRVRKPCGKEIEVGLTRFAMRPTTVSTAEHSSSVFNVSINAVATHLPGGCHALGGGRDLETSPTSRSTTPLAPMLPRQVLTRALKESLNRALRSSTPPLSCCLCRRLSLAYSLHLLFYSSKAATRPLAPLSRQRQHLPCFSSEVRRKK
jgi:hypothetical protein